MLYQRKLLVKRLNELKDEWIDEGELLRLATPRINNIDQTIELIEKAIDNGYKGHYTINVLSKITALPRQTLYRWEKERILTRHNNQVSIVDLLNTLRLIKSRLDENVTLS